MDRKRSIGVTIFGVLSFILGLVFILSNLDVMEPSLQYKEKLKIKVTKDLNTMLNLSQQTSGKVEKKLNENLSPQVKQLYESKQIELASRIKELKRYLEPDLLEENTNKIINFRLRPILGIISIIFGIVILITSIGIFLKASWIGGTIYVSIPLSIIDYILSCYSGSYIRPLLMPTPPYCGSFIILFNILFIGIFVIYNFFLYRFFTRPYKGTV